MCALNLAVKVLLAMIAFAANSLFCRMALTQTEIAPSLFNLIRLCSGAVCLFVLTWFVSRRSQNCSVLNTIKRDAGIIGGLSLFTYAFCFALAYVDMTTGTGALLLFGSVQLTMIAYSLFAHERFTVWQWIGFLLAILGLVILLLPSVATPPLFAALMMIVAGVSWGIYSILGKKSTSALFATTGNFIIASVFALSVLPVLTALNHVNFDIPLLGGIYALASGVLASAIGYAIWYSVLPKIRSTSAATVQLSVPAIATLMGWGFLDEALTFQIVSALLLTLGGIYIVIRK